MRPSDIFAPPGPTGEPGQKELSFIVAEYRPEVRPATLIKTAYNFRRREKLATVKPALNDHLLLATDFSCTESLPFKTTCIRRPPA